MRTTPVRRIAALLMSIFMLVGMLPAFAAAVCPLCGGTNVTQEAVESVRIHGNGDGTHTTTKVTTVLTYCSDCQVTSDAQETLGASETTECVYPEEGGVCEACLTTPCGHSAAMLDQIWIGMGYTCEPLNKEFHALYSNAVLADVCMECEEIVRYYEDSAESEYIENEQHDYDDDGCCASCGYQNVCTHPEEYLETEVAYEVISVNAVVDDLYHNVLVDVFEEVRCSLCGMRQECIPLELGIVEDMPHEFVDGYCSVCGHAEPEKCTHPEELMKTKVNEYSLYTGWDEEEHIAEPERAIVTMCGLCGEWIAEDVEKLPSYREPHTFDKNGQCTGCMYLQECGHESYSETYWPTDIEYLRYDEDYHYGVATLCKYACCDSCGSILKTKVVDDGYVFSQPHLFDEGICLQCGYISQKDVCYHPEELYEGVESFVVLDDPTYDETTHSYTAELYMDFYCGVCGEFMHSELADGEVGVREDHQIDEETGKCLVCDYQIVCEHDGEVVVNYVSEMSLYNSLISYDDEKHTMYGQAYICTYCADCGMLLKKEDPGKPIYFTAEHKYERVGASYQCSECTYDPVSKTVDMHIDDWYECDHDFVDGVCTKCSLVICNHPEESIGEVVVTASETYTEHSSEYHIYTYDAVDVTECLDCGKYFGESELYTQTLLEPHSFDESSTCIYCGYVNECEHPVEAQLTTGVHLNVRDIKPVDEFYHQHTCDYYEYTVCTLCNEPLSNMLMEEGRTHEALHEYEEYVCVECGEPELAVCPHPEEALVRYSAIRENVYDYDETYHVIETEEVEIVECELCKQSLSVTVVDCELDFFEHVYNRGGQCVCWHVNFCDHEGERSSDYAIYDWSFTSINDLFHTVNGKYCVTEYCEECDNALSTKVIDEDFTSIERHDFNEMGNCQYCDYAVSKRCEHPEESIITYDLPSVYHEIEVISSDADSHTISFSVNRTLYCTACNTTLETYKVDEIVTKTEPHMYIGALGSETCIFCGYENPCTHENERTIIIPLFCTVEDMTEETHTIRGSFTEVISCADCGCYDWDRATIKGPNELATAEHNLNEDGYCLVCGYNTAGEPVG